VQVHARRSFGRPCAGEGTKRGALFAALTLAATGCIFPSEPVERLELSITLSSDRVVADSGLGIRLAAVNPTDETLRIQHLMGCRDPTGQVLAGRAITTDSDP
jgi:hypothetical protein